MILTPGQLYFINEQDTQTGVRSNYYKIGIVRDADDRDSENRLLEHQTGNPRKLCIVETLSMPAVEAVETNLHYLFASKRVMGEWMCFSDDELKQAIAKAKELAVQMQENIKDFEKAEKLKKVVSNSKILPATPEADELYATIMNFKEVVSSCKEVLAMYQDYIREAIAKGVDVRAKANLQTRAGAKKFDPKLFESKYPDLYKKYSISTASITGAFRAKQDKNWSFDISTLEPEQVELLADFKKQLKIADNTMETGFVLHSKHLGALEIEKYAEWESQMANTKLRVLTGEAEGIEGICTWKRELKETISLDKDKLKAEQPNEYNACMVQGAETEALVIHPKIAQAE
jgi:hypothetical protein